MHDPILLPFKPVFGKFQVTHRRSPELMTMLPTCKPQCYLPLIGLAFGAMTLSAEESDISSWNSIGSAGMRIVSPDQVDNPSGAVPIFSEIFHYAFEKDLTSEAPNYWIIRNTQSTNFAVNLEDVADSLQDEEIYDEDSDEENDIEIGTRYFAFYEAWNSGSRRTSERGMLTWRMKDEHNRVVTDPNSIGFVRAQHRPSELPSTPVVGHFTGADGNFSWAVKSVGSRTALIDLAGAAYHPEARFQDFNIFNISATGNVSIPAFTFPVPGLSPANFWRFDQTTPVRATDDLYFSVLRRLDARTMEEIHPDGSTNAPGHVGDPREFWSRHYFLLIIDDQDSDRDGIPDFADLTKTLETFPWYTDYNAGNNWYYAIWLNDWIFADRRLSLFWDYRLDLGWTYVPLSSSRNDFWVFINGRIVSTRTLDGETTAANENMGWLYTNRRYHPNYYRFDTGETLQLLQRSEDQDPHTAVFYNFDQARFETVQF